MPRGLTYSVACPIYWVMWYFPVISPDRDIPSFPPNRLIESSKIGSVKLNSIFFWGDIQIRINIINLEESMVGLVGPINQ